MDITRYFEEKDGAVSFQETQASAFAKGVAGDFNPIHDPGSRRFCVPGDLLFSVLLYRYGIAQTTSLQLSGMLDGNTRMELPDEAVEVNHITDSRNRALLSLFFTGPRYPNKQFAALLSEQYVKFSGQTFPDILVPLMRRADVMINPDRPMIIYKDMAIMLNETVQNLFGDSDDNAHGNLQGSLVDSLQLQLANSDLSVNGRKGVVRLQFTIEVAGSQIGTGEKNMVLSGLREFEEPAMQSIVDQYNTRRHAYQSLEQAV